MSSRHSERGARAGGAAPEFAEPELDARVIGRLAARQGFIARLLGKYAGSAEVYLGAMRAASQVQDAAALAQHAHALKGGSNALGAVRVGRLCQELETRANAGDCSGAQDLILEIEQAVSRAVLRLTESAALAGGAET